MVRESLTWTSGGARALLRAGGRVQRQRDGGKARPFRTFRLTLSLPIIGRLVSFRRIATMKRPLGRQRSDLSCPSSSASWSPFDSVEFKPRAIKGNVTRDAKPVSQRWRRNTIQPPNEIGSRVAAIVDLLARDPATWTIEDLILLVAAEAAEDNFLELKEALPTADNARGWAISGALHKSETQGLATEVVAFANARGGRIVVGIEESSDNPKRATKLAPALPKVDTLVERLRDALHALIDPPIRGLAIVPIRGVGDAGYVVLDVPKSPLAPHGVGKPPRCYRRRDSSCQPMEMSEVQNTFWDSRMVRERLEGELAASRNYFHEWIGERPGFCFRMVAVAEQTLSLHRLCSRLRAGEAEASAHVDPVQLVSSDPLGNRFQWRPSARGAERTFIERTSELGRHRTGFWSVDEAGVVQVCSCIPPTTRTGSCDLFPDEFTGTAARLFAMVQVLNRWSGFGSSWVLEGEFWSTHARDSVVHGRRRDQRLGVEFQPAVSFRPIYVATAGWSVEESFRQLEDRVWSAFRLECPDELRQPPDMFAPKLNLSAPEKPS